MVRGETDNTQFSWFGTYSNRRLYRVQHYLEEGTVKSLGDGQEQYL